MNDRRAVALLIETSNAYARGLLEGIVEWIRQHNAWSIYLPEQMRGADPPTWLSRWKGDGIIARIETQAIAAAVRKSRLPVVDVSAARLVPEIPWVETNDQSIAELAAQHLLDRGFQHFGFCGDPGFQWSTLRETHFVEAIQRSKLGCSVHRSIAQYDPRYSWNREKQRLIHWLKKLPRPVGIMCCYDVKAQQLLDVCRELDVAVPEEVAVVGVDNDHLLCELSDPPLSSVAPDARQTGFEAAELLNRMMSGDCVDSDPRFIEPLGIEVRQSSDVLAIEDHEIAAAVRFIRENATSGIQVADVLREVPLSRRALEGRFVKILGRTPHQEIMRLRIDRVKRLLLETDRTLSDIARAVGFEHVEYLSVAFKREVGTTPKEFRKGRTSKK
ncbi:DNA-binding transcriptional regulator [Thalassoglobus sp. JC818]|uniref:AraC family transcriptional regulator n=1 Tax=Thalassoglobus sp. JC818 TaxID=3232136 RepID=UPI00345A4D0E